MFQIIICNHNEEVNTNVIEIVGLGNIGVRLNVRERIRGRLRSALWIGLAQVTNLSEGRVTPSSTFIKCWIRARTQK